MPQMSHLMWSELFLFFSILFLFSSIKTYFLSLPTMNPHSEQKMNKKSMINWMW